MWTTLAIVAWAVPPSIPDGGCRCYVGQTCGNDVVDASFRLCREGRTIHGGFDWTGQASGRSFRVLEGTIDAVRLELHDTALPLRRPAAGWRFCTIERYALTATPEGGWVGTYDSTACQDHAEVALRPSPCPDAPHVERTEAVRGPRPELVPDEVQSCRARGYLWLSDPDWYERTEIETEFGWKPVWQVLDRQGGRLGHLLVYPESCRVVVGIVTPGNGPKFDLVGPTGSAVTAAETVMLNRMAGIAR